MTEEDDLEKDVLAWLQSEIVETTARYVKQGRRFANLSVPDLTHQWTQTVTDTDAFIRDERLRELHSDCISEFSLRQIEPPWDLVQKDWDKIRKAMTRSIKRMSKEALGDMGAEFVDELEEFKFNRNRPKN